jgi:taurine dioxygenase
MEAAMPHVPQRLLDIYPNRGPRALARPAVDPAYKQLILSPLSPSIGVEVTGVDLREPLSEALDRELYRALLEWKVLVFREQPLSAEEIHRFASRWGEPYDASLIPAGSYPAPFVTLGRVAGEQNYWHADDTFMECPGIGTVLRVTEVPSVGGDTVFSDMASAYDNLPEAVRESIGGLRAVHDCAPYAADVPHYRAHLDEIRRRFPPVEHPVVRTHPETGRLTLFVNSIWTQRIVGLDVPESDAMLLYLSTQATVPEYQCRIRWTSDTLVFWDNRAVQHYAVSDYLEPRTIMRCTLRGDRPF